MKNKKLSENYLDYIKSKTWQIKRTERLKIDNFTCQKLKNILIILTKCIF